MMENISNCTCFKYGVRNRRFCRNYLEKIDRIMSLIIEIKN